MPWSEWRIWRIASGALATGTFVATVVGLYFVYSELHASAQRAKVERSLRLVERFGSGELTDATARVSEPWSKFNEQLTSIGKHRALSIDQIRKIVAAELASNESYRASSLKLAFFFDEVWSCVDSDVCDFEIVCKNFHKTAADLNILFQNFFDDQSDIYSNSEIGFGVLKLARIQSCENARP